MAFASLDANEGSWVGEGRLRWCRDGGGIGDGVEGGDGGGGGVVLWSKFLG